MKGLHQGQKGCGTFERCFDYSVHGFVGKIDNTELWNSGTFLARLYDLLCPVRWRKCWKGYYYVHNLFCQRVNSELSVGSIGVSTTTSE